MSQLTKGWFESQLKFDARKKAEEEKFDASVKSGEIGRVVNDPEEQKRVVKYRQEQAKLQKERQEEVAKLNARRQAAKDFQYQQEVAASKTQIAFDTKELPKVAERLSLWKPKRHQMVNASTQVPEISRKPV
jgi:transcriptional antiterminator